MPSSSSLWARNILFAGVGVVLGYLVFFSLFQNQCADLIKAKERQHAGKIVALNEKHQISLKAECGAAATTADSGEKVQDLLSKQTNLAAKYEELLAKHEVALRKLNSVEKESDGSALSIAKLEEDIRRLRQELGASAVKLQQTQQQSQVEVESLQEQLRLSQSLVRQKVDEVRSMKVDGSCSVAPGDQDQVSRLQGAIRRRNMSQCEHALGSMPYVVELVLGMESGSSVVQVEFTKLHDMPHTIWTFLSLVDEGLYVGTKLRFDTREGLGGVTGGEPRSGPKQVQSALSRKYAEAGYSIEPLMFEELSPTAKCTAFSFGLVGLGPGMFIPLDDDGVTTSMSCPGTIVRGKEVLSQIRDGGVTIKSARILRDRVQRSNDEL